MVRDGCKKWNTKCLQYGRKKTSCRAWNEVTKCTLTRQKKSSCRKWNFKKHCRQHGRKKHCDYIKKATGWARIPYPCGTRWCKRGWFRFPCGVRICHRHIARDIMGWSCKMVTNYAHCVRHTVQRVGCRAWNLVPECVRHQVEKVSCRGWNYVKDFSRCLHSVTTSCQLWNMVEDLTDCVGGWTNIAGKCVDGFVGHCSKWAETCTENVQKSNIGMFNNCGVNMLPFVPV